MKTKIKSDNSKDKQYTGTVKWFSDKKGFGFIEQNDKDKDVFVHYTAIICEEQFKTLNEGDKVQFCIKNCYKGPVATKVIKCQ